jgi:hypothetical protein
MQALTDKVEQLQEAVGKYKVVTAKLHAKVKSTTEENGKGEKRKQALVAELRGAKQKHQEVVHRFEAQRPHFNTITGCLLPLYKAALNHAKERGEESKGSGEDAKTASVMGLLETPAESDLPDLALVADAFMAISDDLMLSLIRLRDLEREDTSRGGELSRLTQDHKGSKTALAGLQQEVTDLKKQNAVLDDKHAKMKPLLVRANKHMEDTKRKVHAFKANIAALTANLTALTTVNQQQWVCRPSLVPAQGLEKEEGVLVETQVEPEACFVGVPVEHCKVLQRIQAEGEVWLLLSSPAGPDGEEGAEAEHSEVPSRTRALLFWTTQTVFLERRALRLESWQQEEEQEVGGGDSEAGAGAGSLLADSDPIAPGASPFAGWERLDPRTDRQTAQSLAEVTLSDGLRLPEAMLEAMRQTFAGEWKAHAAQFQHNLQAMTLQLEEKNGECKAVCEELARYKARAHSVLEAQAADIAAANRELAAGAQLRADNARLSAKSTELANQLANHRPEDLEELRGQLDMTRSQVERLEEELKEAEDELQGQQGSAKASQVELRRQCTAELELVRGDLGVTETALRQEKDRSRQAEETVKAKTEQFEKLDRRLAQLDLEYTQLQTDTVAKPDQPISPVPVLNTRVGSEPKLALRFPVVTPPPAMTTAADEAAVKPSPPPASSQDFLTSSLAGYTAGHANGPGVDTSVDTLEQDSGGAEAVADGILTAQAARDPEQSRLRKHVKSLQVMLQHKEIEASNGREVEGGLKRTIASLERENTRNQQLQANMTYLKNIFIQYMTTDDHEQLFPVICQMLQLSPHEIMRVNKTRASSKRLFGGWI